MAGLTAAFGFPYNSQFLLSAHNCCENGSRRVPSQSPHSPHVCSCHLEQVLQQKMNALPPGIFPRTSFGTGESNVLFGQSPREPSTVYPPLLRQCDVKDMNTGTFNAAWFVNPRYDQGFDRNSYLACHPFADRFSPIDLNSGARRKNATRETTSTLKAWLYEHRKNPYPTKGEKIMLAILTKMTLTQVSTWFANARRRLKKENKMTWSPRNRCGERKDSEGYSDDEEEEDEDQDEEETKNEELSEERTQNMCRKTTVIKTPEDAKSIYHADSARAKIMGNGDSFNQDQQMRNARDVVPPTRTDQRIIWPNARSPAETEKTCPTNGSSIEDSPVKSLRKWVDGCFDQNRENSLAPVTDTPPLTPPNESERLTETVTQLAESEEQTARQKSSSSRVMSEINHADEAEERLTEHSNAETTNREIDAALALTTLFSRS